MAIELEFINIIIPIEVIDRVYKDGWDKFKQDNIVMHKRAWWHDDHLYREGAMNPMDIKNNLERWEQMGANPEKTDGGNRAWDELCVVDVIHGPTLTCNWIGWDYTDSIVWLKGKKKGTKVFRHGERRVQILVTDKKIQQK